MGFLQKLFGGGMSLGAPVPGELVGIKKVNDPTFSECILGKGVAIIPSGGEVVSPADGTVSTVFPTGHAAAVTTDDGAEILIHVGLDTVKLDGKHFTIIASEGQKVKKGDPLINADLDAIKAEGYDIITPVIICNSDEFSDISPAEERTVASGDPIMTLRK